jgi:NAD-dependent DNA ligase
MMGSAHDDDALSLFLRFNGKKIRDRQVDTLIGLSKGITADEVVNQAEAEFLFGWLVQNQHASDNPVILNLLHKISSMLEDGMPDQEESSELLAVLRKIGGEPSELGELAKAATLPVDDPLPEIRFEGSSFLFTGTCAFGTRAQCNEATAALGGVIASSVRKNLDFLVIGTYVTVSCPDATAFVVLYHYNARKNGGMS